MNYKIIKATEQGWQQYKKIRLETLEKEPQAFSSTYSDALTCSDSKWKELLSDKQSVYLLVFENTSVIGVGRITFNDPDESSRVAVIGGVYINISHRKCGLGQKLVEHLIAEAKQSEKIKAVMLEVRNTQISAINLYTKLGFQVVGERDNEVIMKRTLN
jgi:ribosomal protein S18 acetylase RimI-like enzyme